MRYIRYAVIAAFAVVLITVSLANRSMVTLKVVPDELGNLINFNPILNVPLFFVIFAGVIIGLCLGFAFEWLREHKHRAEAATKGREARRLARENDRLRDEKHEGKDEILALLDKTG